MGALTKRAPEGAGNTPGDLTFSPQPHNREDIGL